MTNWYTNLKAVLLTVVVIVIALVGVRTFFLLKTTESFLRSRDVEVATVASNLNATLKSANTAAQSISELAEQGKGVMEETRTLVKTQGSYQAAQNEKINDVLLQTETALINFQRVAEDVNDNQKRLADAVVSQVNHLGPLVEGATNAVNTAALTMAGPDVQGTLHNIDTTMGNISSITNHVDHTFGLLAKKVDDNMKPQPWWKKSLGFIYKVVVLADATRGLVGK